MECQTTDIDMRRRSIFQNVGANGICVPQSSEWRPHIKSGSIGVIRWGDGEMGRWGDGEMGRWGDGEMGSERNIW
ncbi:MAG: hypothetical protein F6K23_07765 [Okeania sp. SIO2C9]|uniref:hypothetical protein n=1 Tax=Okeania sp. SIO2C9 TaxID=2607791 RepID=UPI0013C2961F|nr:hypothetical protein [Okeania sp. SIO2C9]NEQ72978.1 hypothetical protein [Okeania sp. SIO2C9]